MNNSLAVYDVSVLMPDMTIFFHQTVEVKGDRIVSVRPYSPKDRDNKYEKELEGSGKLLMPGLCDCHMHTGQQLLKGKILDELPMIWTRIMLPFESTLTPEKNGTERHAGSSGDDKIRNNCLCRCGKLFYGERSFRV